MGLGKLLEAAFTTRPYCTDWLDTAESQAMLDYQRHSFADIVEEMRVIAGWRRHVPPPLRPLIRRGILRMSPYLKVSKWPGSRPEACVGCEPDGPGKAGGGP